MVNSDALPSPEGADMVHLEQRPFRPFKSSEEYLYAMKEDLAEWLGALYRLDISADNFMDKLETGIVLCEHANNLRRCAAQYDQQHTGSPGSSGSAGSAGSAGSTSPGGSAASTESAGSAGSAGSTGWRQDSAGEVPFHRGASAGSFFARDNVHSFVLWCRRLGVPDCLLFETEDLVSRKNEKHVILCLLEVARRGARFGMAVPVLVLFEQQIDRELCQNLQVEPAPDPPSMVYGPVRQVVTNDLKSLHEMVRDLVERCTCPIQFPMIRVAEGKYRIGDTKTLIFVRVLRNHVMVRVGGGWDTLAHYLDKHDPCRCRAGSGHRTATSSKFFMKADANKEVHLTGVRYDRSASAVVGSSPALRQRSQVTPERRRYEEASGDSSSEVSDEGYRSQGHSRFTNGATNQTDHTDRAESRLTQTSSEAGDASLERTSSASAPLQQSTVGRAATKKLPQLTSALRNLKIPGGTSEAQKPADAALNGGRQQPRARRGSADFCRLRRSLSSGGQTTASAARRSATTTWSGAPGTQRGVRQRPELTADTFRAPSASPAVGRRRVSAPSSPGGTIFSRLLDEPRLRNDDARLLERMRELVAQYGPMLQEPQVRRVAPRRDSQRSGSTGSRSRIPAPVYFKQPPPPTETCL